MDFEEPAAEWMGRVVSSLSGATVAPAAIPVSALATVDGSESEYSRSNPFQAEVLENLNLNGRGSDRETRHIELSLEGSNLQYEPGDSLGIYPENHPRLVDELIEAMNWQADEPVPVNKNGEQRPLREALLRHYEITVLTKPPLEQAAQLTSDNGLQQLLEAGREQELRAYLSGRDLLDLVQDYSFKGVPAGEFVSILRKSPARLYSIASGPKASPGEVHVTVRAVRYEAHGRDRYGVCSVHLAERVQAGETPPVFIQQNPNFKLPANPETPVIMIGPGTGVAPFRAFLGEREETGAEGKTWLFFGDQHFSTDFLYQVEWRRWLKEGVLTRMDVAFSRDTDKKVYVQHRMLEKSRDLYEWLQEGAHVYVCGDEKKMAHDVHNALAAILEQEGGLSPEEAAEYLTRMQQQKRYQRDVY
ncbi:sulfite reductase subunit alpha [Paenibacillus sp. P25]|nr:sulfite reductase subunit alpha [Paenibacillus sp. P25]